MPEWYAFWERNKSKDQDPKPTAESTVTVSENESAGKEKETIDRGQWARKSEFILSCVGLSVGLGNVWRFPYLAYQHGGAAFLIAYMVLQVLIGKPMYMMELILGQYSSRGPTGVWAINPCAKGIGISMALISLVVAVYYNVIMAYTLYYFFTSMQKTLPWTVCKDEWLPLGCVEQTTKKLEECTGNIAADIASACKCTANYTLNSILQDSNVTCTNVSNVAVAELFFEKTVIQKASSFDLGNMGAPIWHISLCLALSWTIVVACLIKGVKSSGKVVYFTATFPYLILLILLVRGCLLDGAIDGVKYFIIPDWNKLLEVEVWVAAAGQMFFSLGVSFGGIIMFGSYNKLSNNVYGDALFISLMDLVTSIIAGFVIFTTFGGMAKQIGVEVQDVAKGGYGLAFVAYPEALTNMVPSQLWSIMFFFMLFTLGLDSEFGLLETVLTCIQDEYPHLRKYKSYMCVGFGVGLYLLALPCVTPAGDYIVTLMDHYGADLTVIFVAVCECIAVMWVYGVRQFIKDCTYMIGHPPKPIAYWACCWTFCSPILLGALLLYRMVDYNPPSISKDEDFPQFAQGVGWVLTTIVLIPIPTTFLYTFYNAKGTIKERLRTITTPTADWGPKDGRDREPLENNYNLEKKIGVTNPGADNDIHCIDT